MESRQAGHDPVRLNKYIADAGLCSRREADRLIQAGLVTVDGHRAVPGETVLPVSVVCVKGRRVGGPIRRFVMAVNKPAGIICTSEVRRGTQNIHQFLKKQGYDGDRVFPIGRLDKDSEGLLLMTNDGALADEIMRSVNAHEKEYEVRLDKEVTDEFVRQLAGGVHIQKVEKGKVIFEAQTRPCEVEKLSRYRIRIVLTQGLNRQIRRMCESLGYQVVKLSRTRIMNVTWDGIRPGSYRILNDEEYEALWNACAN